MSEQSRAAQEAALAIHDAHSITRYPSNDTMARIIDESMRFERAAAEQMIERLRTALENIAQCGDETTVSIAIAALVHAKRAGR